MRLVGPRPRRLEPEELEDCDELDEKLYGAGGKEADRDRQDQLIAELRREEAEENQRELLRQLGPAAICKHQFIDIDGRCIGCGLWTGPDYTEDYDD